MSGDGMTDQQALMARFEQQKAACRRAPYPSFAERLEMLDRLQTLLDQHEGDLHAAVGDDFGQRSATATGLTEVLLLRRALRHARRHLASWMRPRRVHAGWSLFPARAHVVPQPLGVMGIMGAWNYPLLLLLGPLVGALAAGNRAMLKPSELAPRTAAVLDTLIARHFAPDTVTVVCGGAEVAGAFAALPFDHLVFTGSTAIGRRVAMAAAPQLTPLTLELGGKSPMIVDRSADVQLAARRIIWGKLLNAGQTCVAPDHVLLPADLMPAFVEAARQAARNQYPQGLASPDYVSILNARHWQRLHALVDDAQARGARLEPLWPDVSDAGRRLMVPQVVCDVDESMAIMQEEIFGPLLPLVAVESTEAALERLSREPRPLTLSWFGRDARQHERLWQESCSGSLLINDTLVHLGVDTLPFGGTGASGYGHYHGEFGFRRFSHEKALLVQARWNALPWLYPPWGAHTQRLMRWLATWLD